MKIITRQEFPEKFVESVYGYKDKAEAMVLHRMCGYLQNHIKSLNFEHRTQRTLDRYTCELELIVLTPESLQRIRDKLLEIADTANKETILEVLKILKFEF